MNRITEITSKSLNNYFDCLRKLGYKKYSDVYRLLVLSFLEETLLCEFVGFVTEEDYKTIISTLYWIGGQTYMIEFPSYATYDKMFKSQFVDYVVRIDESDNTRISEDDELRIKV